MLSYISRFPRGFFLPKKKFQVKIFSRIDKKRLFGYNTVELAVANRRVKRDKTMPDTLTLDKLPIKYTATITSVGGEGALRCRLLDMGLIPNTTVKLQKIAPMGDPMEVQVRGYELTLRMEDAKKISVGGVVR